MSQARWEDARRLESWAGEMRVNMLRTLAVLVFYIYHLINFYLVKDYFLQKDPTLTEAYHFRVTAIFFLWGVLCFALYHTLIQRYVPVWLKYAVVGLDLGLVTALCVLNPAGPTSAFMGLYFVVIATSPLRLCIRLVWFATLGALVGAGFVLGHHILVRVGREVYYTAENTQRVPGSSEVIFVLCVLAAGLFAGQMVRGVRRLLEGYPVEIREIAEDIQS
jgi:hypothetical protein